MRAIVSSLGIASILLALSGCLRESARRGAISRAASHPRPRLRSAIRRPRARRCSPTRYGPAWGRRAIGRSRIRANCSPTIDSGEAPIYRVAQPALHELAVRQLDAQRGLEPCHPVREPEIMERRRAPLPAGRFSGRSGRPTCGRCSRRRCGVWEDRDRCAQAKRLRREGRKAAGVFESGGATLR